MRIYKMARQDTTRQKTLGEIWDARTFPPRPFRALSSLWFPQLSALISEIVPAGSEVCIYEPFDGKLAYLLLQKGYKTGVWLAEGDKTLPLEYTIRSDPNFLGFSSERQYDCVIFLGDITPDERDSDRKMSVINGLLRLDGLLLGTAYISEDPAKDGQILPGFPYLFYDDGKRLAYSLEGLHRHFLKRGFMLQDASRPEYLNSIFFKAIKCDEGWRDDINQNVNISPVENVKVPAEEQKRTPKPVSMERFNAIDRDKFKRELTAEEMKDYLSYIFFRHFGYVPDFDNPRTYNEKLNWLKIYYHNPKLHIIADKARFHSFVLTRLPGFDAHCIKPLAMVHTPEDMTNEILEKLPDRFVIKSNFGSGAQEFVDKRFASIGRLQQLVRNWLNPHSNHYYTFLEYAYKDIPPAVIIEPVIDFDYKIELYCFDGEPFIYWVVLNDKTKNVHANLYSMNGEKLPVRWHYPNFAEYIPQPPYFRELVEAARKLSKGFPHVRVDFYAGKKTWYFSEMTFYTWGGVTPFSDIAFDMMLGKKINLKGLEAKCE